MKGRQRDEEQVETTKGEKGEKRGWGYRGTNSCGRGVKEQKKSFREVRGSH